METAPKAARTTVKKLKPRRQVAIEKIIENQGNVSKALREAGYSDSYAHNPHEFTNTQAYQSLIEKHLPDEMLLETHGRIVNSPRIKRTFIKGAMIEEVEETDPSQVRGLDMAYKLKGKYQSEGITNNVLIVQVSKEFAQRYGADTRSIDHSE